MNDEHVDVVEDPPNPDLADLQQRIVDIPSVPVRHEGPIRNQPLPSRAGLATTGILPAGVGGGAKGASVKVLDADLRRSRAQLVATVAWFYKHKSSGEAVPWPANVPCVILHCDSVYACAGDAAVILTVISEFYAD